MPVISYAPTHEYHPWCWLCGSDVCATSATCCACPGQDSGTLPHRYCEGGTYYPEGSLFSDCELEYLQGLIDTATNRSWRAKVASLT